jgi:hypothetical protein
MKSPKAPKPTAEEKAMVARQTRELDEEIGKSEKRLKAVSRGTLGSKSLLAKGPAAGSAAKGPAKGRGAAGLGAMGGMSGYNARIGLTRNR